MQRFEKWTSVAGGFVLATALMATPEVAAAGSRPCVTPNNAPVLDFNPGAEGLAVSRRGDVFAGNIQTGEVWFAPRGNFDQAFVLVDLIGTHHPFNFLLGMDVTNDGTLYVAVNAFLTAQLHGLWRIERDGTATKAADLPVGFQSLINDAAIDQRGNVYASDSLRGAIWRLTPDGDLDLWSDSDLWKGPTHPFFGIPFGVNGLAYHHGALYGALYLEGRVVRVPINHDGSPGVPEILIADPALVGADGIELDPLGNIYVTVNDQNTLVRIDHRDLRIETLVSEGLSAPASFALSPSRNEILVANLSSGAPVPKPHAPAVVRISMCAGNDGRGAQ